MFVLEFDAGVFYATDGPPGTLQVFVWLVVLDDLSIGIVRDGERMIRNTVLIVRSIR